MRRALGMHLPSAPPQTRHGDRVEEEHYDSGDKCVGSKAKKRNIFTVVM